MTNRAIVTLVIGDRYRRLFDACARRSWEDYALKIGAEIIVVEALIDGSKRGRGRSPAWQKCLIWSDPRVETFEQVVWIDSDIIINPAASPSVFDDVPVRSIGVVDAYRTPDRETYERRLRRAYAQWRRQGVPFIDNPTPETYFTMRGLPPHAYVPQTGVFVFSPLHHRDLMSKAYAYEDPGPPSWNYEMGPLAHEMAEGSDLTWLDPRFNMVVSGPFGDMMLSRFLKSRRAGQERLNPGVLHPTTMDSDDAAVIRQIISENYFTHFAGMQDYMWKA